MTTENKELEQLVVKTNEALDAMRDIDNKIKKGIATELDNAEIKKYEENFKAYRSEIDSIKAVMNSAPASAEKKEDADLEYKSAFDGYFRKGKEAELEQKALSSGSDTDGGYLVPNNASKMINARIFETSPIRQYASVQSITGEGLDVVIDDDEASSGWVNEVATRSETDTPQLGKKIITAHEQFAIPQATQKLLDDSGINIEQWLSSKVADIFSRKENTAFITGDGISKPTGLLKNVGTAKALSEADAYSSTAAEVYKSGGAGTFTSDNLLDLLGKLKASYRNNAVFFCSRETEIAISKLKDGDSTYLFNFDKDGNVSIRGKKVVIFEDMPAKAVDAISIGLGDLRTAYQIVDRMGIRTLRDPYTQKPFIKYYTTKRVGGDVVNYEALKFLKLSS